jgi:diaminopropionate ammonia-lyase
MEMEQNQPVKYLKNNNITSRTKSENKLITNEIARKTSDFHKKITGYHISPLKGLNQLSNFLGLGGIWVKDESERLNLNSFKILGGSYAIYKQIKEVLGVNDRELSFSEITSEENREKLKELIFATATDGNHGRGVAWTASKLGIKSVIYVHSNTAKARIKTIESYGAIVKIINGSYDEAVEQVTVDAKKNNWQIIADTAWEGYEKIPTWIMQGYSTMYLEVQEQLAAIGIVKPTHIFVQAGVGSLAASVVNYYKNLFNEDSPTTIIVEPENANCIFQSAIQNQDKPVNVEIVKQTIMAGLECGNPNPIAWDILKDQADYFFSCPDYVAAKGMRVYGMPLKGDPFIVSGESGAVTLGALMFVMQQKCLENLKHELKLDADSQVLLINSEGNTDPINYKQVVWDGLEPVPLKYRTEV